MKRRIFKLGLFLLLGAIINVAVAWGCQAALDIPYDHIQLLSKQTAEKTFDQSASRMWRRGKISHGTCQRRPGLRLRVIFCSDRFQIKEGLPFDVGWPVFCFDYGWPFLGVGFATYTDPMFALERHKTYGAIELSTRWRQVINSAFHTLPYAPRWPGFAINTVFYAAILWLLFAAPGVLRRQRRIKRGLCPVCTYPVGSSDVCTECGKPVKA